MPSSGKSAKPPVPYTEELAAEICDVVATSTIGLRQLCSEHSGWPLPQTVYHWMVEYPDFERRYDIARRHRAQLLADEIIDITDAPIPKSDLRAMEQRKLMVDARKWLASRLLPKKYGDKLQSEVSGPDGSSISEITIRVIEPTTCEALGLKVPH